MGEVFPLETEGYPPPQLADLHWLSLSDSLREAKSNAKMVVVITCLGDHYLSPYSFHPHSPTVSLSPSSLIKTAAQAEASKAGFTHQSSSRENGCCFQVLFAHLLGGDCSGENEVLGLLVFNIILFKQACVGDGLLFSSYCSIIF